MAGFELKKVETDARGNLDLDDLRAKVNEETAGLMLTNPSTLGLFDEHIEEVAEIFHGAGALLYYDGANLNAVCGISRPGDMGFDIVHYQPAQDLLPAARRRRPRRRPGRGARHPGAVSPGTDRHAGRGRVPARLQPAEVDRQGARLHRAVRRLRPLVRLHPRLRAELRRMSEVAVLNANYMLSRLRKHYDLPFERLCMHEFVLSARNLKREHGVNALDVAKRLMDYGFHPPTIYFPLIVPEALMIEPTETEPKETLDAFCDAMEKIAQEAASDPEMLKEAPHRRPVRRLDEVKAAKRAIVKYGFDQHPDLRGERAEGETVEAQKGA